MARAYHYSDVVKGLWASPRDEKEFLMGQAECTNLRLALQASKAECEQTICKIRCSLAEKLQHEQELQVRNTSIRSVLSGPSRCLLNLF
jgi:hypothetical protein